MYVVSDSDGRIYKEGTEQECKDFLSKPCEVFDFLPLLKIYTMEEWLRLYGATEE